MKKNTISRTLLAFAAAIAVQGAGLNAATLDSSTIYWTGTADSNWGNSANWSLGQLPGESDYIGIGHNSPTTIYITNTNTGNLVYAIGGLSVTPNTGEYNISLQGTGDGLAILNVAGAVFIASTTPTRIFRLQSH
ncbi:hypothetical protein [Ereboglobus luteus]|uniref:Uncharacterized protein n=1 Tax=Ereboglobus luteus TaxID=1796921 RepID=A0A2U8E641_9BACT|nr:hypothetical protein [Ereboglobus luteus]AWI10409.1 hypothetical protein CKA38_15125 [Ereboglobus luteus]